jgi:hypothetical protein
MCCTSDETPLLKLRRGGLLAGQMAGYGQFFEVNPITVSSAKSAFKLFCDEKGLANAEAVLAALGRVKDVRSTGGCIPEIRSLRPDNMDRQGASCLVDAFSEDGRPYVDLYGFQWIVRLLSLPFSVGESDVDRRREGLQFFARQLRQGWMRRLVCGDIDVGARVRITHQSAESTGSSEGRIIGLKRKLLAPARYIVQMQDTEQVIHDVRPDSLCILSPTHGIWNLSRMGGFDPMESSLDLFCDDEVILEAVPSPALRCGSGCGNAILHSCGHPILCVPPFWIVPIILCHPCRICILLPLREMKASHAHSIFLRQRSLYLKISRHQSPPNIFDEKQMTALAAPFGICCIASPMSPPDIAPFQAAIPIGNARVELRESSSAACCCCPGVGASMVVKDQRHGVILISMDGVKNSAEFLAAVEAHRRAAIGEAGSSLHQASIDRGVSWLLLEQLRNGCSQRFGLPVQSLSMERSTDPSSPPRSIPWAAAVRAEETEDGGYVKSLPEATVVYVGEPPHIGSSPSAPPAPSYPAG